MKCRPNIKLGLCRIISGGAWQQLGVALAIFCAVLLLVVGLYCVVPEQAGSADVRTEESIGTRAAMAFSDMISPVSFRDEAYLRPSRGIQPLWLLMLAYLAGVIVLSGVLIATITNILGTQAGRFRNGSMRFRFRGHVLMLGYDAQLMGTVCSLCRRGVRVVVAVGADAAAHYDLLRASMNRRERRCLVVLCADRCNADDLRTLRAGDAARVYIVGERHEETRDTLNMMCFHTLFTLYRADAMPECYVNITYQSTFALFQTYAGGSDGAFNAALRHFHSFNFYDEWARLMVTGKHCGPLGDTLEARGADTIADHPGKAVHLAIAGMTEMGQALAREAAFICHYPGAVNAGVKTKITFIDRNARERMIDFTGHYHHLFNHVPYTYLAPGSGHGPEVYAPAEGCDFLDLEFEFIDADVRAPEVRNMLSQWAADEGQYLTVAVCFEQSHQSIAAGLYLPDAIHERKVPVWVYQPGQGDLTDYLGGFNKFDNMVTFGMSGSELLSRADGKILLRAKRLNHFYWHMDDDTVAYDNSEQEQEWGACRIFDRWSSLYNVAAIPTKLRGIGGLDKLEGDAVELLARVEHNRWNAEKLLMGFRAATPEEHALVVEKGLQEKKRLKNLFVHDDIRPFEELDVPTADIDRKLTRQIKNIIS